MITDFSTYTNAGLQNITYHGKNSLTDYGIVLAEGTSTSNLTIKSTVENMPHCDGQIDMSDLGGKQYYEYRTLVYRFKIFAESREALKAKEKDIKAWLNSSGNKRITDSDYTETVTENNVTTTTQWSFQNCYLKSIEIEEGQKTECEYEYLTATFECDPWLTAGGVNERILKFAVSGTITLNITNNNSYTITAGGSTSAAVSYTAAEPYKYRLVCYAENPETITLNGSAITAGEVFTMPSSAEIVIAANGYKYVELWHDTRTGVRL